MGFCVHAHRHHLMLSHHHKNHVDNDDDVDGVILFYCLFSSKIFFFLVIKCLPVPKHIHLTFLKTMKILLHPSQIYNEVFIPKETLL